MFVLCSDITIGGKTFGGVNDVVVKRSVYEIGATAVVKIPVTAVLKSKDNSTLVETAKAIKVGDPVVVRLGYNDRYATEFRGFVKNLNLRTPLEVVCEDFYYSTRSKNTTLQGKATLKEIVSKCGLSVGYVDDLTLANFEADNRPVAWVLRELKTKYGLTIYFDLEGKVYAHTPAKVIHEKVKYKLRYNVISDDDLIFRRADDVKLKIKAKCIYKNGTAVEAVIGADGGEEKTLFFYDVENEKELTALAKAELERHTYDGYDGKITTFLEPFAAPGMIAEIIDDVYGERNGDYFIESVETTFSTSGARRKIEIGIKV